MERIERQSGWRVIGSVDLLLHDDLGHQCDKCGRQLRYVHVLEDENGDSIGVGRCCAQRLCHGYDADGEETKLRNLTERRSRWLTRKWRTSMPGNDYLEYTYKSAKVRVVVFKRDRHYRFVVTVNNNSTFSIDHYRTSKAAKMAAFDCLTEVLDS